MKFIILATILVISFANSQGFNPYKENKSVGHSLYREKDSDRMSAYPQAIPTPIEEYILLI
jgi:hypothetical protein